MVRIDWKTALVIVGAAALLLYVTRRQVGAAAAAVGSAINPVSDKNLAYQGVNAVVNAIAGDGEDATLGTRIYDFFHGDK